MPDYKNMTATAAMRHAKGVSGLTAEEIASRLGVRASVVRRYLQHEDGYAPGMDKIPALCAALENTVLFDWIEAQLEPQIDISPAQTRAEVLTAAARVSASLGDVQRRLADSEEKGIDPVCARELRGLLHDVISDCRYVQAMLAEAAAHTNKYDCKPLASLRRLERTPWWRFWRRKG